jgi:HPt (histidine-containing phosphotransfer) domain-containing protein
LFHYDKFSYQDAVFWANCPPALRFYMGINQKLALEHVDGDDELLADLAAIFLEDCPRLIRELYECIGEGDNVSVERVAHTLKGRLAFFGMEKERGRSLQLEDMGKQCELSGAPMLLAELEDELKHAIPEFQELAGNNIQISEPHWKIIRTRRESGNRVNPEEPNP